MYEGFGIENNPNTCFGIYGGSGGMYGTDTLPTSGTWHNIVVQLYNGYFTGNDLLYVDGVSQTMTACGGSVGSQTAINAINIGSYGGTTGIISPYSFYGQIANIQVYNTSLSPGQITTLNTEGIGGVPIEPQNLVAWWPLNGNANDYSGDNNQGTATNVIYTA